LVFLWSRANFKALNTHLFCCFYIYVYITPLSHTSASTVEEDVAKRLDSVKVRQERSSDSHKLTYYPDGTLSNGSQKLDFSIFLLILDVYFNADTCLVKHSAVCIKRTGYI
jgi:hypothetical protein